MSTVEERFHAVVNRMEPRYAEKIRAFLSKKGLKVVTNREEIDRSPNGPITVAGTIDGFLYVRAERIPDSSLDFILLHEAMHMFIEERDGLSAASFRCDLFDDSFRMRAVLRLRQMNEAEAILLSEAEAHRLGMPLPSEMAMFMMFGKRSLFGFSSFLP